jgi:uncharacterized Tic20 family protein
MKTLGLILGFLLLLGGIVGAVVVVLLLTLTNNRINFGEAVIFLIPTIFLSIVGFIIIMIVGFFVARGRQRAIR